MERDLLFLVAFTIPSSSFLVFGYRYISFTRPIFSSSLPRPPFHRLVPRLLHSTLPATAILTTDRLTFPAMAHSGKIPQGPSRRRRRARCRLWEWEILESES